MTWVVDLAVVGDGWLCEGWAALGRAVAWGNRGARSVVEEPLSSQQRAIVFSVAICGFYGVELVMKQEKDAGRVRWQSKSG